MAQFSGAVKLADLNDFIAPSQACVVNINGSKDGALQIDNKPEVRIGIMPPQGKVFRPACVFDSGHEVRPRSGCLKLDQNS